MSDDRPKKSFAERDKMRREGGSSSRTSSYDRDRDRASKTQAYSAYKSQLGKLFSPGGAQLPEHMREQLGPQSDEAKAARVLMDALTETPGEATLRPFLEHGAELPPDPRLLMRLLDTRDEALLRPVLQRLLDLIEDGKKPSRMLLIQRLESVKNFVEEDETLELVNMTRAALD
jgi:hypothetical protein